MTMVRSDRALHGRSAANTRCAPPANHQVATNVMLNFRQIEVFRTVMLAGSMTQAAQRLHTSQPNISRVIGQLERRLGMRLFERVSGRLVPTQEGTGFFQDVEHAFSALRNLEDSAASIRNFQTGRLRIVAIPSQASLLVPKAMAKLAERYPNVTMSLQVRDSLAVCQAVASGHFDVGIASEVYNSPGTDTQLACESEGICIVPRGHHLARRDMVVTPDDLDGERFLSLARGDSMRRHIDHPFTEGREDRRILMVESHYAAALCGMVSAGMGVSIVNPLTAFNFEGANIAMLPFRPRVLFPTFLIYPQHHPNTVLSRLFANQLIECIGLERQSHRLPGAKPDASGGHLATARP